jgi:hypothetical protein
MKTEIDFLSPAPTYQELLFDVKLHRVFSDFIIPSTKLVQTIEAPNDRAVVNQTNGKVVGMVGKNYKLISNKEAIEKGKQIFTQLYPHVQTDELIPFKVFAPLSKSSAHIDLIHKNVDFGIVEQDRWLPFLRISNSYNRSCALSYEIGFVRALCSNGVLFNKKSMKLKYYHINGNKIEVNSDAKQIEEVWTEFKRQCIGLQGFLISRKYMFPLVCKVLNINLEQPHKNQLKKKIEILRNIKEVIVGLTKRYFDELGDNAYAAFNVVTDLVSRQDEYKNLTGYYFNVRSFYARPTDWMEDFSKIITDTKFDFQSYLKPIIEDLEKFKDQSLLD